LIPKLYILRAKRLPAYGVEAISLIETELPDKIATPDLLKFATLFANDLYFYSLQLPLYVSLLNRCTIPA